MRNLLALVKLPKMLKPKLKLQKKLLIKLSLHRKLLINLKGKLMRKLKKPSIRLLK